MVGNLYNDKETLDPPHHVLDLVHQDRHRMRATPPRRTPALRPGLWSALVLSLLVAGVLTAGTVRGAVNAKPAAAVRPGGSLTPQPSVPTPTPTRRPPSCELGPQPAPAALQVTGTATPTIPSPTPWQVGSHTHFPGQYQLQRTGDLVTAILTTRAAPLP